MFYGRPTRITADSRRPIWGRIVLCPAATDAVTTRPSRLIAQWTSLRDQERIEFRLDDFVFCWMPHYALLAYLMARPICTNCVALTARSRLNNVRQTGFHPDPSSAWKDQDTFVFLHLRQYISKQHLEILFSIQCLLKFSSINKQEAKLSLGYPTVLPHTRISDCC